MSVDTADQVETLPMVLPKKKIGEFAVDDEVIIVGVMGKKMKWTKEDPPRPYIHLKIQDNSGACYARIWNNLAIYQLLYDMPEGEWVEATVVVTEVGQFPKVEVKDIKQIERKINKHVDIDALWNELMETVNQMNDVPLRELVLAVLQRPDIQDGVKVAPATQMSAYTFEGGLLAHMVRLIRMNHAMADVYNNWEHNLDRYSSKLNKDLMTAVSILHDIGKVSYFARQGNNISKTLEGELFEDSYITSRIVLEELMKIDMPKEQMVILEHVLGSSKDNPSYGSLFKPKTREAFAFHHMDALDAKMGMFEHFDRNASATDVTAKFSYATYVLVNYDE